MKKSTVYFASARPERLERDCTLPAKFMRLLDKLPLQKRVKGKTVAIKMHVGGGMGYSTIHPFFVKLLVDHIRKGNPKRVFVTDASVKNASARGYAENTVGAEVVDGLGPDGNDVKELKTGWATMPVALIGRPNLDADILVDFSHIKGHGDCGFGGACKNLAMGCVKNETRGKMHKLEGDLQWDEKKCVHCLKCIRECEMKANKFNKENKYEIFWHHCKRCLHCMLICPTGAIKIANRKFDLFQEALARVARLVVDQFGKRNVFYINVLTDITIFCDCWGQTTPSLVPDIGIMAGEDIVATDWASLDAIKVKNVIPGSITKPYKLGKGKHLFERLHARDPYTQLRALEKLGAGTSKYALVEVK